MKRSSAASTLLSDGQLLYLSSQALASVGLTDMRSHVDCVADAYRTHAAGDSALPMSDYLTYEGRPSYDRIISLLGYLGGPFNVAGLKQIASSTSNATRGWQRASGLIILNDPESNRPFAVLEGARISALRTAAVTGLALRCFMPEATQRVALIGAGYLARQHLEMWRQLFPGRMVQFDVYDTNAAAAARLVDEAREHELQAYQARSAAEAIRTADVIVPMTTAESPYIEASWLQSRSLYAAVSLLDPQLEVLRGSDAIVVDDLRLCQHEGRPLQRLQHSGELDPARVYQIGDILSGRRRPPAASGRVFFNPMGTIITDLCVAVSLFEQACAAGVGTRLPV